MATQRTRDKRALDRIARLLCAPKWPGSSGLEDIREIVATTGREIHDDPAAEWHPH